VLTQFFKLLGNVFISITMPSAGFLGNPTVSSVGSVAVRLLAALANATRFKKRA
jgi:hypothetical protein